MFALPALCLAMQNVLVVDDELDVRDAIKRVLERAGYTVRTTDIPTRLWRN